MKSFSSNFSSQHFIIKTITNALSLFYSKSGDIKMSQADVNSSLSFQLENNDHHLSFGD
jgi:hypothetical protein